MSLYSSLITWTQKCYAEHHSSCLKSLLKGLVSGDFKYFNSLSLILLNNRAIPVAPLDSKRVLTFEGSDLKFGPFLDYIHSRVCIT